MSEAFPKEARTAMGSPKLASPRDRVPLPCLNADWHRQHPMPKRPTTAERLAWHIAHAAHCACRPMPESLRALAATPPAPDPLRPALEGSDRRSLARSKDARALIERDPSRIAELAALTEDPDPVVAMRASDLLEKLAAAHPAWVQPHRKRLIGPIADSDRWEIRLQIVRALPLLRWTDRERVRVLAILRRDAAHPRLFVRAWAVDSLAAFSVTSPDDAALAREVRAHLADFERSGSAALVARARAIRKRLQTPVSRG